MTTDLASRISGLSPGALDLYKQQLRQKMKTMRPEDIQTVLSRIQGIPQLTGFLEQTPAPPQEQAWWQKGLQTVGAPFQWLHEKAIEPFAAFVTDPWTPEVPGTEGMGFGERQRAEYQAWDDPNWGFLGVKGVVETLPWLAIPSAAGVAGRLGALGGKAGALGAVGRAGAQAMRPAVTAERIITYPIAKPIEMIAGKISPKLLGETARFIAPTNEAIESQITHMDWQRKIAQWFGRKPVLGKITEATGGKVATVGTTASVEDVTARALLIGIRVQETLTNKRAAALANLRQIHPDPVRLFGIDEATGLCKGIKGKTSGLSKHVSDIAEHPNSYRLSPIQRQYIDEVHRVEDWVLDGLKEAGVEVKMLKFDEFSHWVHRVVLGKKVDGKLVELKKGFGRVGSKQTFQKTRFYETAADGLEHGIVYSPNLEQAVDLYVQSAAKSIGDKRIADMVAPFGAKPLERAWGMAPEIMGRARETAITLAGARRLTAVIRRAARGEKLPEATLAAQERRFPEMGRRLRDAMGDKKVLNQLAKEVDQLAEVSRVPYWKAKAERVGVMEAARTPSLGTEATIFHPAFQGKIYPIGVADEIQKYWSDLGFSGFAKAASISGQMRTLVAAADFSAMFIQGLPCMALHPKAWASGAVMSFRAFKNPNNYQRYLTKELQNIQERVTYGGYAGGFEFMEAMPGLRRLARQVGGRRGEEAIRQTYGRFEASFGAFGDVARNEMWKGLRARARTPDELFEIARHLDRMTGVMSTKGLGIGKTLRDFEAGFLFFAPRYTRAGFALIGDVFKGGLTGAQTRQALGSMMAAGAAFYTGICVALGQTPNFNPSSGKFMTIEITDPLTGTSRHFGIGGMMTSLARFSMDASQSILGLGMNEPLDFVKLSRYDNPFIRFMYSKSAPLTGFISGMIEGKNYFGEPFENVGDYAKFMAEQVLPIAVQEMIMEEGGLSPTAMVAEELGMRTFPRSDWEKRNVLRDELAQERFGMSWDDVGKQMGEMSQKQIEQASPELQEATKLADETSTRMARGEGKVWSAWGNEIKDIQAEHLRKVSLASREFEAYGDGTTFREKVEDANKVRSEMYASLKRRDEYTDVYTYFDEPLDEARLREMNPNDIALKEYYRVMYAPEMYDQYGNYLWDRAEQLEQMFVQQFGQGAMDYIEQMRGIRYQDYPRAYQMLYQAKEVLQPYWDIERQIWSQYSPELQQISDQIKIIDRTDKLQAKRLLFQHPDIVWARRQIAFEKKRLKWQRPEIDMAIKMFYSY